MANIVQATTQRPPQGRKFWFGRESVQVGVAPTGTGVQPIITDPVTNFDSSDQREVYDAVEYTGAMTNSIGMDEMSHYVQMTVDAPFGVGRFPAHALMSLMGNQSYNPSPGTPGSANTHTLNLAPLTNTCNTFSCWWQTTVDPINTANYIKQFLGTKVSSVTLNFAAGAPLTTSISMWGRWPTYSPPPAGYTAQSTVLTTVSASPTVPLQAGAVANNNFKAGPATVGGTGVTINSVDANADTLTLSAPISAAAGTAVVQSSQISSPVVKYVGGSGETEYTITRTPGWGGTFTLKGNSGATYNTRIVSGSLTFERDAEAIFTADSQTIIDIALGPLRVSGSVVFVFDGYNGNTIARDYDQYKPAGTYATPNILRFSDGDLNYVELQSAIWKWNPFTLDYGGQYVKGNGTFTAYNDPQQVQQSLPVLSIVKQLQVRNYIGSAMITP